MVLLYAIPSHFNHVIFDLFWGYPSHGRDYLDASCLIFNAKTYSSVVDYRQRTFLSNSIWHSGDVMDDINRTKVTTPLKWSWKSYPRRLPIFSSLWAPGIRHQLRTIRTQVSSFSRHQTRAKICAAQRSRTLVIRRQWSCVTWLVPADSGRFLIAEHFRLEMQWITSP